MLNIEDQSYEKIMFIVSCCVTCFRYAISSIYNTKVAKIVSNANTTSIKVKALKKGTTTLKIRVNGINVLRLKVKVK